MTDEQKAKLLPIVVGIILVVVFVAGIFIGRDIFPREVTHTATVEKPVITTQEKVVTQTQVAYVPKETVVYKDANGNTVTAKEVTDVQADIAQPKVGVKVNGKDYKFDLLQGETQKFQDGKVLMTQTSDISFKVDLPEAKVPKWEARFGTTNGHSIDSAGATYYPTKNAGVWVQHQKDTNAGGISVRF